MRGMPNKTLTALVAVLLPPCVGADEASEGLGRLLDSMTSYRAEFEQTVTGRFGEVLQTATGTMHLKRPGRLRWNVDEPYPQLVVADGDYVWVYDPDLEQATVQPFADTVQGTPAMVLTDTAALEDQFLVEATPRGDDASTRFVLTPRETAGSDPLFRKVTLSFSPDGLLTALDVVDHLEQETRMAFLGGELNPVLESGLFRFEPPDGVDVIGNHPDDGPTEPGSG